MHARIMTEACLSVPLNELHPDVVETIATVAQETSEGYAHAAE
jgi:hypothetical protein